MKISQYIIEGAKIAALLAAGFVAYKAYKAASSVVGDFGDKVDAAKAAAEKVFIDAKKSVIEVVDKVKEKVLHDNSPSPQTRLGLNPEVDDGQEYYPDEKAVIDSNQSDAETARLNRMNAQAKNAFDKAVAADVELYNPVSRYSDLGMSP